MSASWVAGSVRARALTKRRLGQAGARRLAASGSLDSALRELAATGYGRNARPGLNLAAAQHEIAATVLWNLQVLAGWLPRDGVGMLRTLAAWFELANVDEMLAAQDGPSFELGALETAWPRLRAAGPSGVRAALAASAWQDPGGDSVRVVRLGMRVRYTAWLAGLGEPARSWAAGAAALLLAGEHLAVDRAADPETFRAVLELLGAAAASAGSLAGLATALPSRAGWVLAGAREPADLWRAEITWRARVERDGLRLLRTSGLEREAVLGAVAVLACDALRVRAALEVAARGSRASQLGAYDELA
ncbi:MAG TPA: hypothetical protein VF838_16285 [Trebonia sp.]